MCISDMYWLEVSYKLIMTRKIWIFPTLCDACVIIVGHLCVYLCVLWFTVPVLILLCNAVYCRHWIFCGVFNLQILCLKQNYTQESNNLYGSNLILTDLSNFNPLKVTTYMVIILSFLTLMHVFMINLMKTTPI